MNPLSQCEGDRTQVPSPFLHGSPVEKFTQPSEVNAPSVPPGCSAFSKALTMARPSDINQQLWTNGRRSRSAFTLLELTVVMAVLGVVAVAASSMLSSHTIAGTLAARQQAELLASTLRLARSSAIAGQQPVSVAVHRDARLGIGYRTALASDPNLLLQPIHYLPEGVTVEWSSPAIVFQPYGMSDRSLSVSIRGSRSTWILDVHSAAGQVFLSKKE